ncbi:hypothetical protein SAMN05421636_10833 [Pricia antarctica]|uniref:Patatin-like phospholipase n=1 Tax=Pricia antarctica TaxID=641691 RepID=A0A1G7G9M9_9FLAO|nr:hypothetical protein [Pricia antarctica]SDE84830.1 hypothetical protein SAMN05421636_10833 [Pricia antarctica]
MLSRWFNQGTNSLIAGWILITLSILVCNGFFWINDYISSPQHGLFDNFNEVSEVIRSKNVLWYRLYFLLDFFWGLYLLIIIGSVVKDDNGIPLLNYKEYISTTASTLYVVFASVAFLFDCIEGICYLFYWGKFLEAIYFIKMLSYSVCLSFLVYWLLKTQVLRYFKAFLRFVWTSLFSILFLVVIYLLITIMPQGGTIIVDLFYNPWNILLLFFLLAFLAIMISHYPIYADIWMNGDNTCVHLEMDKKIRFHGFGIIYYKGVGATNAENRSFNNVIVQAMRRSLGIMLYLALFNILLGVISQFFEVQFDVLTLTIFILVATLFLYYLEGKKYDDWKVTLAKTDIPAAIKKQTVEKIVYYVKWFPRYFLICTFLVVITTLCAYFLNWNRWTIILFLLTLGFQMFLYIMFKIARSYFKYVYRSEFMVKEHEEMYDPNTLAFFKTYDADQSRGETRLGRFMAMLSHNVRYLRLMQISGLISLVALVLANSFFEVATFFNPLVIILLYIIFFYSLFVIIFKHLLYYHRRPQSTYKHRNFFKYGIPLVFFFLVGWMVFTAMFNNDLHQLSLVDRELPEPLSYESFLASMTKKSNNGKAENYFLVGSYGGGLKANLWNLLLLHRLEIASDKEFFNRTLVMSGVSGGAVGIGNFASLLYEQKDSASIARQIEKIGRSNVLSNELTYLLGRDLVREYLPFWSYAGRDRSYKSMQQHAKNTGMKTYNTIAFDEYWRKIYDSRAGTFPALIINTTAVGGQQGLATSVQFPENTFAGAKIINEFTGDLSNKTLTYFGAISTTNRFPFFSPTAKIPNKGSYLDGGYFDNSGMLSTLEVFDAAIRDTTQDFASKINPVFINIINSEDFYIAQKIKEYGLKPKSINDVSEIGSIIGTVASIDKFPRFVLEKIRARGYAVELIMMPHKLSYEKIKQSLNGEIAKPLELMEKIALHNDSIDAALRDYKNYDLEKWGVIQPPLARLLSIPAVRYQEAMINKHASVKNTLQRILDIYINTEEVIDTVFQNKAKRRAVSKYQKENSEVLDTKKRD